MLVTDQVRLLSDADLRAMPFRLGDRLGEWSEDVARACVDELLRRERERCAAVAEAWCDPQNNGRTGCYASFSEGQECTATAGIAAAIRGLQ